MIVSSLSLSLAVKAIMISLCFKSSCLYLSTYALSSSIYYLSLSNSLNLPSYSCLIILYFSSNALLNYGVSSIFLPPTNNYELSILIFSSSFFFSSFSIMYSLDLDSKAVIAAILSSSALLFYYSNLKISPLSTTNLLLSSSSPLNFFNSNSYFLKRAL